MIDSFQVVERVVRRAPLDVRMLDLAGGRLVADGLVVQAVPLGDTRRITAERSPVSGNYGFRSLPGLTAYEWNERAASDWCSPPADGPITVPDLADVARLRGALAAEASPSPPNYTVWILDLAERFLPEALQLCLPRERLLEVPLFSAPWRRRLPGSGLVRGELRERASDAPAAWALITASPDGVATYVGVADQRGMFGLYVPYATPLPPLVGSPPHGAVAIDQLSWPLDIRVFYSPGQQHRVPAADFGDVPEMRSILGQAGALVYDTPLAVGESVQRALRLGQDTVVATAGLSWLLVDAA